MKNAVKIIIKSSVFLIMSFIFLNVYFPAATEAGKTKQKTINLDNCQWKKDSDGNAYCTYEIEIR